MKGADAKIRSRMIVVLFLVFFFLTLLIANNIKVNCKITMKPSAISVYSAYKNFFSYDFQ